MDIQYHAIRLLFENKPFFAPIGKNPERIIDFGTGTGKSLNKIKPFFINKLLKESGRWMLVRILDSIKTGDLGLISSALGDAYPNATGKETSGSSHCHILLGLSESEMFISNWDRFKPYTTNIVS